MAHITPVRNGWTENAGSVLRAIERKERGKMYADKAEENAKELDYYEENNCFPHPAGYFGSETDAHFYER